jgi:hypothetical protein
MVALGGLIGVSFRFSMKEFHERCPGGRRGRCARGAEALEGVLTTIGATSASEVLLAAEPFIQPTAGPSGASGGDRAVRPSPALA